MQATADVTKKESSWSSWRGQGTDAFTVISSSVSLSVFCGCERWTVISACRLNIHDAIGVCPCALHVYIYRLNRVVGVKQLFTCASFHAVTP